MFEQKHHHNPHEAQYRLFKLLDLDPDNEEEKQKLDGDAIIEEVHRSPHLAESPFEFSHGLKEFPLHQAIALQAPVDVVAALCSSKALREKIHGNGIIHYAICCSASLGVIELLLDKKQDAVRDKNYSRNTPLHMACQYNSPLKVVLLLLKSWPDALRQINSAGCLPLHTACQYKSSLDVIALLVNTWPDALRKKSNGGYTPLHIACRRKAWFELVSLLLTSWPGALRQKCNVGSTPLHAACFQGASLEVVSLLIEKHPCAAKERCGEGDTPLHKVCCHNRFSQNPLKVILLLLGVYPQAAKETNEFGKTPLDLAKDHHPPEVRKILLYVSALFEDNIQNHYLNTIMTYFVCIQWWKGMALIFDRHPTATKLIGLRPNTMADFLSMIGRSCKLMTMWGILRNEQELLGGV